MLCDKKIYSDIVAEVLEDRVSARQVLDEFMEDNNLEQLPVYFYFPIIYSLLLATEIMKLYLDGLHCRTVL
jgi:hypothetical protein